MVDPNVLQMAQTAVAVVGPYLAGKVADGAAWEAGKTLFAWLKEKLTGAAAREAVEDFEQDPGDELNREALKAALSKALRDDVELRESLASLLREVGAGRVGDQVIAQSGTQNKAAQALGKNIKINIG